MVLKPEKEQEAEAIFRKWGLDFAIVGHTTRPCASSCGTAARWWPTCRSRNSATRRPNYDRPWVETPKRPAIDAAERDAAGVERRGVAQADRLARPLLQALGVGAIRSRHPRQYRAAPRAAMRPWSGSIDGPKALALTCDVTPRYCEADPFEGGKQAVAECWRNITAVGGRAARRDRQSQFRQSGTARDHGATRRLHPRHRRGLPGARFPGRLRQCLALQ